MKLMVFDVGGTEIKYSVIDDQLNRTDAGSCPTPSTNQEDFLETLTNIYLPHKDEVEGIAMSLPGFIDAENGVVRGGGLLKYNIGTPVGPRLAERCGCPVRLENDGKAAAMAEMWQGALKGCSNASVFIIGTGVGGGLIVDGKLVRGRDCTAGEFSFVNTNSNAWNDADSTMAMQCSTTALLNWYREAKQLPQEEPLDGRRFFADVNAGDEVAKQVLKKFCDAVAVQIYNLTMLLDIEKVAIGGGISKQPILLETLRQSYEERMNTHAFGPLAATSLPRPEIVACNFRSEANQVGAMYSYLLQEGKLPQ